MASHSGCQKQHKGAGPTILAELMRRSLMPAALSAAMVLSRLRAVGLSADESEEVSALEYCIWLA